MTTPNTIIADLAAEVESLKKQRDDLILAVADHVTVRCEYIRQRDELLDALKDLLLHVQVQHKLHNVVTDRAIIAIANAKGGS